MNKVNRIVAILGIVFLVGLYICSLIGAIISTPNAAGLFKASVFCTLVIPILIYGFMAVTKAFSKDNNLDEHNK